MGPQPSKVIAAAGILLLALALVCLLLAIWGDPWWAWLATGVLLLLVATGFGAWSSSAHDYEVTQRLLSDQACARQTALSPGMVCELPKGHTSPHRYVRSPL